MAFKAPKGNGQAKGPRAPGLEEGSYPARLLQVVLLGEQPQRAFEGKAKPPVQQMMLVFELSDEFMPDENGEPDESKPRVFTIQVPFFSLDAERAKSTLIYKAFDPEQVYEGDWSKLVGEPCNINLNAREKDGTIYNNITSVTRVRPKDVARMPELVNPPVLFDFYEPDMGEWTKVYGWVQDICKKALDFDGSALEAALEDYVEPEKGKKEEKAPWKEEKPAKKKAPKPAEEEDENDEDWD